MLWWWIFHCLVLGCVKECWQLVIKSVSVPEAVRTGETDYVILDCDYELENTPSRGLVVKWFFNGNDLAYQWIYGREPQAGEPAAKYVDLTYKASDDPYTKYRAMKLNKPGIDLTGEYTCVVFTFADERSASASMLVYSFMLDEVIETSCRNDNESLINNGATFDCFVMSSYGVALRVFGPGSRTCFSSTCSGTMTYEYVCGRFRLNRFLLAWMNTVIAAEDTFELGCRKQTINDKDGVEITCKAEGLYPQPTLDISINDLSVKQASKESITLRKDGLYNILSRAALLDQDLPEAAVVKCSLGIPKANYNVSRKTVYYPGRLTTVSAPTTKLLRKLEIQALDNSQPDTVIGNFGNRLSITYPVILAYLGILHVLNKLSN